MTVAALFVRATSIYKTIPDVDCYDEHRDALTWPGGVPGIFHPPCRGWGKLAHFANVQPGELDLARWSMEMVRKHGGVIEHPQASRLWAEQGCIGYGIRDRHNGILIPVYQSWFGHRAPKITALYIVGPLPDMPQPITPCQPCLVENMGRAERERTPYLLASWLVHVATNCERVSA